MAVLVSVQAGRAERRMSTSGLEWESAICKRPVEGPVWAGRRGLSGDQQADHLSHGGPDRAVLCYASAHYPDWRRELDLPEIGPGGFGENLTIEGLDERTACIGDRYAIGGAVIEVSQPRSPCWKISEHWERPELLGLVEHSGRHGWYARVLVEGMVEAGQEVELTARPHPEWSVRRAMRAYRARAVAPGPALALAACPELAARTRREIGSAAGLRVTG